MFVVNDRYGVALPISLILETLNIFPDWKVWLKNGPTSEFSEKSGKSGNFAKTVIFYYQCVSTIKMLFVSKYRHKILICKEIRVFLIYRGLTMKNGPKTDDVIGGHVRCTKFENLFFMLLDKF